METVGIRGRDTKRTAVAPSGRASPDRTRGDRNRLSLPSAGALHFSTRGEYGVRLMVELARHYGAGPVSLTETADHEDLPRPYLEQLVVSLRESGLVTSTRGAHGGYELARPPAQIRMSEVIEALEGPIAPMVCASEDPLHAGICDRTGFCNVNLLWVRVRKAVVDALDSLSLAELALPRASHPFHAEPLRPDAAQRRAEPLPILRGTMPGSPGSPIPGNSLTEEPVPSI
jgi:Rrf2 family cysteine metabolism transcriptional repressor